MKILLLTYLVAAVFAAPAEKTKRNILPGDSRYDAHHHDHDDIHDHHKNEVEINQALGDLTAPSSVPSTDYGAPGLKPGTPLGCTECESFKRDSDSKVNKFADEKVDTQSKSVIESSTKSVRSDFLAKKDEESISSSVKSQDDTSFTDDAVSSDSSKTTAPSVTSGDTSTLKSSSVDTGSIIDSSTSSYEPAFGFSFRSALENALKPSPDTSIYSVPLGATGFSTFDQTDYHPSFPSAYNLNNNADTSKTTFESTTVKADFGSTFSTPADSRFTSSFGQPLGSSFYSSSFGTVPFDTTGFKTFDQANYNPSTLSNFQLDSGAAKEFHKAMNNYNLKAKTANDKHLSDNIKTTIESTTIKAETSGEQFSSGAVSPTDSLTAPIKSETRSSFEFDDNSGFPSSFGESFGSVLRSSSFNTVPFYTAGFKTFDQANYNPSTPSNFQLDSGAAKEFNKAINNHKIEVGTANSKNSTDSGESSNSVKIEKTGKLISADSSGLGSGSNIPSPVSQTPYSTSVEVIPSISSGFGTFDQVHFNPSLSSSYPYNPSFNGFNQNSETYGANYGSLDGYHGTNTFGINTYPGLSSYVPSGPLEYRTDYSLPRFVSPSPSPFPPVVSVTEANRFGLEISNQGSYFSPSIGQVQQFGVSTVAPPYQQEIFRSYENPTSFVQPSPAPFYQVNQPEVKIGGNSFSGFSQQTDANGGYIY